MTSKTPALRSSAGFDRYRNMARPPSCDPLLVSDKLNFLPLLETARGCLRSLSAVALSASTAFDSCGNSCAESEFFNFRRSSRLIPFLLRKLALCFFNDFKKTGCLKVTGFIVEAFYDFAFPSSQSIACDRSSEAAAFML